MWIYFMDRREQKFCRSAKNPQNPRKSISAKVNLLNISAEIKETAIIITLCVFCHKQEGNKKIMGIYFMDRREQQILQICQKPRKPTKINISKS